MTCQECCELLYDYLNNDLDASGHEQLEAHLAECPACRAELDEIRDAIRLYHRYVMTIEPGEGFAERVMAVLPAAPEATETAASFTPFAVFGGLVIALFIVGLAMLLPLLYPVLVVAADLALNLLPIPGIILASYPAAQASSMTMLAATLFLITWVTRRAIMS